MSTPDNFDDFVRQQNITTHDPQADWDKARNEWIGLVNDLYTSIEKWLEKYTQSNQILITKEIDEIQEENLGTYSINSMTIMIGQSKIKLKPIGRLILGARGRVDIIGPKGQILLLIVDREAKEPTIVVQTWIHGQKPPEPYKPIKAFEPAWKIVTDGPRRHYIDLTQEQFFDALMEITNA